MYSISFSRQAEKFIEKAENDLAKRLIVKTESLKQEQVPSDAKVIEGSNKVFRVRVGKYRVLYELSHEKKEVLIVRIDHRENVYN